MLTRAISGLIFVVVLLFATLFNTYSLFGLFLLLVIVGSSEYLIISKNNSTTIPNVPLGIFMAAIVFLTFCAPQLLQVSSLPFIAILITGLFSICILELFKNIEQPFNNIVHTFFPLVYVAVPFGLLFWANFRFSDQSNGFNTDLILGFYFALWSNDTGAYLSGKAFGKNKLFERISPNKTWEGSIGGAVLAIVISVITGYFFDGFPIWKWGVIGLIIAVFGSLGDLVESLFKRSMGVKDSGKIMPGHGGVLDRFDGLLIAAPFVVAFLILCDIFNL